MSGVERLQSLKLVIFDVDGVFTDGRTWQDTSGVWRRYFSVRDTMGIRALRKAGYKIAVVTTETSEEVRAHMAFVGVDEFADACFDKALTITELLAKYDVDANGAAYMSADACDIDLFETIGFGATVPTARTELQRAARFVTSRAGGDGAVLEICNYILQNAQHTRRGLASSAQDPSVASL